jgi:hypothetical protein
MKIILTLAAAIAVLPQVALAEPLDKARAGNLQCYGPNAARKTCNSLAGYTFENGKILNQAEVLISPTPPLVMKTVSPIEIRGDAVCGPLRKSDIESAEILVQGQRLNEADAAPIKAQIESAFGERLGKEVCTTYRKQGDALVTEITIAGVNHPEFKETVIWVAPSDGYRVAP